ncbi:MAG: NAD-dependent epimerase/dehydratase family protein [Spirochaetales bacterium]|nr:NAD-dependent epimerase/dehydratase family protein [Spirochaetales bacterium]
MQPFAEECERKPNKFWGKYGTDKIEAENALLQKVPDAYILRPPYLYGTMNNVYREAFVFDCARLDRPFYLPGDGSMKLQFFHVKDLCRIIEKIIETKPAEQILNVGNEQPISIKDWVTLCYNCLSKTPTFVEVSKKIEQRNYFCFYDYEYFLDVKKQKPLLPNTIALEEGLKEAADWYFANEQEVRKKDYLKYIDENLRK